MWFKNIFLYRLPKPWSVSWDDINLALKSYAHRAPSALEMKSMGFVPPFANDEENERFVFNANGQWLLALKIESRLLPSNVVKQALDQKIAEIQKEKGFAPGRRETKELKAAITDEMMPRAFLSAKTLFAWIDPKNGWLIINAASPLAADSMVEMLNDAIPRFPLKAFHTQKSPQTVMTESLFHPESLHSFSLARHCVLQAPTENKESVRYNNHNLALSEIKAHLVSGKVPMALGFNFEDRLSFLLTEKLQLKNIRMQEEFFKTRDEALSATEDEKARFAADFLLMTGEFSRFLPIFTEFLGGEKIDLR